MLRLLKNLDELLRGDRTSLEALRKGTKQLRVVPYVVVAVLMGVIYGVCMGLYAVLTRDPASPEQLFASAIKVPALFFLTLIITLPSLSVFSTLLGTRLTGRATLRILVAAITVNLAVLASLAPITAFFTLNTRSYSFMKLFNVFFFTLSGMIGIGFLWKILCRVQVAAVLEETAIEAGEKLQEVPENEASPSSGDTEENIPPPRGSRRRLQEGLYYRERTVLKVWILLYAFVGAQMGWVLRPFIGAPNLKFMWFRARESNFFIDVLRTLLDLFSG